MKRVITIERNICQEMLKPVQHDERHRNLFQGTLLAFYVLPEDVESEAWRTQLNNN